MSDVEATKIARHFANHDPVADVDFDQLFPLQQRYRSSCHWTPIDVAARACVLLAEAGEQILDVGAGVGKVCLVGAMTTRARWVGVERDARMVRIASRAAERLGVTDRVRFVKGDAHAVDWREFDAVYMFNPFAELLFRPDMDPAVRHDHFVAEVERARLQLATLREGARLVTYYGYGGELPAGFELAHREKAGADELCMWIRAAGA